MKENRKGGKDVVAGEGGAEEEAGGEVGGEDKQDQKKEAQNY